LLPPTFQLGRPFRRKARSPQIRHPPFAARPPDLRRLIFDHESFAVTCPLALIGVASNPVSVRRPAASLHASFPRSVTFPQLRFASIAMVCSREDFHLQGEHHAGRTSKRGQRRASPSVVCLDPRFECKTPIQEPLTQQQHLLGLAVPGGI